MKHHKERRAYDYENRKKTRLVVLMPVDIIKKLEDISEDDGVTLSHTIRKLLTRYVVKRTA